VSSIPENDKTKKDTPHESGALTAWGAIAGSSVGGLIGLFFEQALIGALCLGILGWIAGALIERSRM
jgi:uncharacterized membrane protein